MLMALLFIGGTIRGIRGKGRGERDYFSNLFTKGRPDLNGALPKSGGSPWGHRAPAGCG